MSIYRAEIDEAHSKQRMQSELAGHKNSTQAARQTLTEKNYLSEDIKVMPERNQYGQQTGYQIECAEISRDIGTQVQQAERAKQDQETKLAAIKAREPRVFKGKWKEEVEANEKALNAKSKEYEQLQAANIKRWDILSPMERLKPIITKLAAEVAEYNVGKSNLETERVPEGLTRVDHLLSEVEKLIVVFEQKNQLTDAEQKLLERIKELGALIAEKEKIFEKA